MRMRQRKCTFLLLAPLLAAPVAFSSTTETSRLGRRAALPDTRQEPLVDNTGSAKKIDVDTKGGGNKAAPVDGMDGKPHEGPFVEIQPKSSNTQVELPNLRDRLPDKGPDSSDGVMYDKYRPEPKQGTTGTEGGVSEKDKARKQKEHQTGEKTENKPQTPKEAPPSPHSAQEKAMEGLGTKDAKDTARSGDKTVKSGKINDSASGMEKPADLPDKTHDTSPPIPHSAHKDHLEVSKSGKTGAISKSPDEGNEGLIRPLHAFILSLTMILFSEVGDKTFLVAALMAMKHDRMVVFSAAFSALITMTVLSAVLGHAVPTLIPKRVTNFLAAGLFILFGGKLLREGLAMSPEDGVSAEMQEVEMELEEKEQAARKEGRRGSAVTPHALELGLGNRKSRPKSRFPTPPRSPSTSPDDRSPSPRRSAMANCLAGLHNLLSLLLSPAWVQTFVMTFLGEWGDRSQIATIAMAAGQDYWWVTLGAVMGHACCTGVAVIGGKAIAGRVSMRVVTVGGAIAFLVFGAIYLIEAFYS